MNSKITGYATAVVCLFTTLYPVIDIICNIGDLNGLSVFTIAIIIVIMLVLAITAAFWFFIEWHDSFN